MTNIISVVSLGVDTIPKKVKSILATLSIDSVDDKVIGHIDSPNHFVAGWAVVLVTIKASGLLFKDVLVANRKLIKIDKVGKDFGPSIMGNFTISFKGKRWVC